MLPAMHLPAIFGLADALDQSIDGEIECDVLVASSRFRSDDRTGTNERQLDPIITVWACRFLVVPADLYLKGDRPIREMRDLFGLLGRVFAKAIRDPKALSGDGDFHANLQPSATRDCGLGRAAPNYYKR